MNDYIIHLPAEYIPYAAIVTGVLMAWFGIRFVLKVRRLSSHGIRTQATLVRIEKNLMPRVRFGDDTRHHTERRHVNRGKGIYRFTDESGNYYEVKGEAPYDPVIGDSDFTVLYNPQNPSDAVLIDAVSPLQVPVIASVVGVICTVVGMCMLVLDC